MDAPATPPEPATPAADLRVIPVLDERLRVSRRSRETGRATRVRKRVRERLETLDLATQREAVHVERVPIDRPVAGPLASREEGDVLVIPVVEQRLVVRTEWVLREEIRITRRRHVERERRTVPLRTEVAIVERRDSASGAWREIDSDSTPTSHDARSSDMYTVIGAFDDRQAAMRAFETLVVRGFPRDAVDLQSCPSTLDPTASTNDERGANAPREDEGFVAGVRHFFASLFGGSDDASRAGLYSEAVRRGGSVVVVDANDETAAERAAEIMRASGGTIDLDERSADWGDATGWRRDGDFRAGANDVTGDDAEARRSHVAAGGTPGVMAAQALGATPPPPPATEHGTDTDTGLGSTEAGRGAGPRRDAGGEVVMPVVQEEVRVGKRAVERGGVRVLRRVTATPVSELVRLREERARVERRPVDREATPAELDAFREDSIEVRERTEEPVVEKVARVVEEVVVGREVDERTQKIDDSVRRTEVEVEKLAQDADRRLGRATGDDWVGDEDPQVAGGPNPPPNVEPATRRPGERATRPRSPRPGVDRPRQ